MDKKWTDEELRMAMHLIEATEDIECAVREVIQLGRDRNHDSEFTAQTIRDIFLRRLIGSDMITPEYKTIIRKNFGI